MMILPRQNLIKLETFPCYQPVTKLQISLALSLMYDSAAAIADRFSRLGYAF